MQPAFDQHLTIHVQGRYHTPILRADWLAAPVPAPGRPGLWDVALPAAALPAAAAAARRRPPS